MDNDDELVEVTPFPVSMRKIVLSSSFPLQEHIAKKSQKRASKGVVL